VSENAVLSATHASYHRPVLGVFLKLASVLFLASMGACVKQLGSAIPSGETIFVRGLISLVVLTFVAWRVEGSLRVLKTRNLRSHALRSLSGTASMFCWFTALTLIPLADFTAISFTAPLFLTILAMLFLGERIHGYRWSALGIGFVGVLIMVGPQLTLGGSFGVVVALGAAVFSAVAVTFLRSMSGSGGEHAITITFYFSVTTMICAAFTALAGWPMPTGEQWLFIGLAGLFGVLGQLLMTYSYRYAEASTVAPLDYANLLLAVLYGYYFFDELPHPSTWIGAPLVIAAGAIILWREYRLAVPRAAPPVSPNV
jgi:drug/metabolite transporter (DMT)-like permease